MPLGSEELERLSDEVYSFRRISASTYCSRCGYNLRTLPYVYTCPECGQAYNARPLHMKGIFLPSDHEPPGGQVVMMLFWFALALLTVICAVAAPSRWNWAMLVIGVLFLVTGVGQLMHVLRQLRRYRLARDIARRIEEE